MRQDSPFTPHTATVRKQRKSYPSRNLGQCPDLAVSGRYERPEQRNPTCTAGRNTMVDKIRNGQHELIRRTQAESPVRQRR
jgi:hypothetical protein